MLDNRGSRQYFQVDIDHSRSAYNSVVRSENQPNGRILIVDDDRVIADILKAVLTEFGYKADIVYDGLHALKMAHNFAYDLVSMDIKMPRCDGDDAIIAMEEAIPDLPVLVVSGHLNNRVRDDLKLCKNVRGLMEKPVDLEKYVENIRRIISSRKERNPRT